MIKSTITYDSYRDEYKVSVNGDVIGKISKNTRKNPETGEIEYVYHPVSDTRYWEYFTTIYKAKVELLKDYERHNARHNTEKHNNSVKVELLPEYDEQFYPTPGSLAGYMISFVNVERVKTILEPSAGKGDLAETVVHGLAKRGKKRRYIDTSYFDVDCIEKDVNLANILRGKGLRVVHDDFFTFSTHKKYDIIIMNPPFANAELHILKALSMIERTGGQLVALCNANTIKHKATKEVNFLRRKIKELNGSVKYVKQAFIKAERKTNVEVAVIYFNVPDIEQKTDFWDKFQQKFYEVHTESKPTEIVLGDEINGSVQSYNFEIEAGLEFIRQYRTLAPYIMNSFKDSSYNSPIIKIKVGEDRKDNYENEFIECVRYKYWSRFFDNNELYSRLTSELQNKFSSKLDTLVKYDYSQFNIRQITAEMGLELTAGRNEQLMKLFDKLTAEFSYIPESSKNIHYFNGWKTNKAHKIGKKVIIPMNGAFAESWSSQFLRTYDIYGTLSDIEKSLNYLNLEGKAEISLHRQIELANMFRNSKNIECEYFTFTLYKKGTCHITFTNPILIDRLNIFAARQRGWLPPSYGNKHYVQMNDEEKAVIDSFQGKEEYEKVMANKDLYLDAVRSVLLLPSAAD